MTRFGTRVFGRQPRQQAFRMRFLERADPGVHRPPRAMGFEDGSIAVEADVPNFGFTRRRAVVNTSIHHQTAAHAAPERNVEHRVRTPSRAVRRFAERGDIGVVVHKHRGVDESFQPAFEREVVPAVDMVRAIDPATLPIDRATETNADRGDFRRRENLLQRRFNLPPDAGPAFAAVNRMPMPGKDATAGVAHDDLQFCAANFDA